MTAFWDVLDLVLLLVGVALLVLALVLAVALCMTKLVHGTSAAATWTRVVVAATTGVVLLVFTGVVYFHAHPTLEFPKDKSETLTAIGTVSGDVVTAIIAGTTLYAVILLRMAVREQTKQLKASAIQNIGNEMLKIDRWMVDNHPKYRDALTEENSALGAAVAEVYGDLIAQVHGQKDFLGEEKNNFQWENWEKYFRHLINTWPQLRNYMEQHPDWYGEIMIQLASPESQAPERKRGRCARRGE